MLFVYFCINRYKIIKKGWKIALIILAVFFLITAGAYLSIQSKGVQTFIIQRLTNEFANKIDSKIHIGRVDIGFFYRIILKDVVVEGQNNDTLIIAKRITAHIDSFSIKKEFVALKRINLDETQLFVEKDSLNRPTYQFILDSLKSSSGNSKKWDITCKDLKIEKSSLLFNSGTFKQPKEIILSEIDLTLKEFTLKKDSVLFNIDHLGFINNQDFILKEFKAKILSASEAINISDCKVETNNSRLNNVALELIPIKEKKGEKLNYNIDLDFNESILSFKDIAILAPKVTGMDQTLECSGRIYGNLDDLKGKNITMKTGLNTLMNLDFYANGVRDFNSMYLFLDLRHFQTDFKDLSAISLPTSSNLSKLSFPESFYEAGVLSYKGNFSGFLSDFVAFGTLESDMGSISTDISIVPGDKGNVQLKGKLATSNFEVGQLYNNDLLGKVSFNSQVYGIYNKFSRIANGTFDGIISTIDLSGYSYKNISLDGGLYDKKFNGKVNIDDPNLRLDFNGELDLNSIIPVFNYDLLLYNADLVALKLDSVHERSEVSLLMKADFEGNSIDNLKGSIRIENGNYRNQNGEILLSGITLENYSYLGKDSLNFTSDFIDATIQGTYNINTLRNAIKSIAGLYIPALLEDEYVNVKKNYFDFYIKAKDLNGITNAFAPGLEIMTPFEIEGSLNCINGRINMSGGLPGINYKDIAFRDIVLYCNSEDKFSSLIKLGEFQTRSGFTLYNLALNTEASNNILNTRLTWNNYHLLSYSGGINTTAEFSKIEKQNKPRVDLNIIPSKIYIADSLWRIDPCHIIIDSTSITIDNFRFHKKLQSITGNGKISENKSNRFELSFHNIRLGQFEEYLQTETGLKGLINGTAGITDLYGNAFVSSDLRLSNLVFRGQEIGNVSILNNWDNDNTLVRTELKIEKNDREQLFASGYYDPIANKINYDANFDHLSLVLLEKLIRKNFSNFHGDAVGKVKIHGDPEKILIDGTLYGENAGLTLDALQVSYHFNDSVKFSGDSLIFDEIEVFDAYGNTGVFDGSIRHDNFKKMDYDLSASSGKILAMNTTPKNNEQFYGKIFAAGNLYITGHGAQVDLDGDATTLLGTAVNISLDYDGDVETYDFIQFVNKQTFEKEEIIFEDKKKGEMNLNLTIRATPDAKAQIIYNSKVGDVIKAEGEGVLRFGMDKDGEITLYGDYNVDQGEYLFTLQNVINKKFTIEKGGSIIWSGNPYNAIIDLNAVYGLKASLYELFPGDNLEESREIDNTRRIQVYCKILLTDDLNNPNIDFKIDFPTADDRVRDKMQPFFNTKEEMNKQIISLLVLGQFYTPEYMRGTYEATSSNVIGTTASELFSNQLSNWLSQISNDIDFGVNYRPGNQLTNDEIEFALSTQMFNDRVTINGNIGNNVNRTNYNNNQIVGDFDMNVKLTNGGKLRLKAYNRSNNNLIYETAPYTQGIGFTYKEEFNTLEDLIRKFKGLFSR